MDGRSYMYTLKRRGAKIDLCETPFFRRRSQLDLLSPVVKMKLLFRTSSIIIQTMCLSGRSLSSLQVRPRCGDRILANESVVCKRRLSYSYIDQRRRTITVSDVDGYWSKMVHFSRSWTNVARPWFLLKENPASW